MIAGFLILILLLIFVAQNTASTPFHVLCLALEPAAGRGHLAGAVGGGLLTVAVGTARMLQLRRTAKKHHAAANERRQAGTPQEGSFASLSSHGDQRSHHFRRVLRVFPRSPSSDMRLRKSMPAAMMASLK